MEIIPVVHCFDNNYVLPAAVAFYSLLEKSDKKYYYKICVLHNDVTLENQEKLKHNIKKFKNSEIIFIDMEGKFKEEWKKLKTKGHFSKEMFYKLFTPTIFKEYKKIIISDVDVVYLDDISKQYIEFLDDTQNYFAGVNSIGTTDTKNYFEKEYRDFSLEEKEKLKFSAGFFIMNLEKCRKDNIEIKFLECFNENYKRLKQPEQDILSLCCYPKIKELSLNTIVCSFMYKMDAYLDVTDKKLLQKIEFMKANPIQLHYATAVKPWNNLGSLKAEEWFKVLVKTNFLNEYLQKLQLQLDKLSEKKIMNFKFKYRKKKEIVFSISKKRREE